ncbi:hypothetical protein QJS10_CPA10g01279 [Acorus calamus]|uniref:Transposase MuDR plant domain-containing protein n=1 Tax=Acorus calamus TaxID=4465 RepID=A0AAV9DX25_ACOCL|nr:hypothetical protein QJS10_CPA10g01279 [Acorus calamus]
MLPNILPRLYVEASSDAKLLEIFTENQRTKKFTLYVVESKDDAPSLSISHTPSSHIDFEGCDIQNIQEETDEGIPEEEEKHEELLEQSDGGSVNEHEVPSKHYEGGFIEVDSERPKMSVGSRFPTVDHFRYALKQHCVINEFTVKYIKNERYRVTTQCRVRHCTWRIHASELQDRVTFKVKTLKDIHTCTSVNKVGNEMATSGWLANKMVSILHKTPELGASKLKGEIQNKYNLTLPYSRVLKAKGKALELMHGKPEESYKLIPELREELLKANPCSIVE